MPVLADNYMVNLNKMIGRKFSLKEFYRQSSLIFTEAFNGFGLPISTGNDIFPVGSHCPTIGKLDQEMLEFLNDPQSKVDSLVNEMSGRLIMKKYGSNRPIAPFIVDIVIVSDEHDGI
uniref:Uncharacterized protein n=1 Tax=Panagrolaimus sp. JU765 TaxID=591449 RepID=A0AC34RPU8_9BILA